MLFRSDSVEIPRKLRKYQWLNVNNEHDYYDIQFFIDILWDKLMGAKTIVADDGPTNYKADNVLLREKVVILLQGKNIEGNDIFTFLELSLWRLSELRKVIAKREDFSPKDYGVILEAGAGPVPDELYDRMRKEHNMIDVPRITPSDQQTENEIYQQYMYGFNEAFKSILGDEAEVPLVKSISFIPNGSNAFREGIKMGMAAANAQLKNSKI